MPQIFIDLEYLDRNMQKNPELVEQFAGKLTPLHLEKMKKKNKTFG